MRNISTQASNQKLINDVIGNENRTSFSYQTFVEYNEALQDLFLVENTPSWCPKLRSKANVRNAVTRHFVDPSIALLALEITPKMLLEDANALGLFFEDLANRDLNIHAMANEGKIDHYRDSDNLEVDAILRLDDGRYGLIEIKLGSKEGVEEGIKNLAKLKNKMDDTSYREPSFSMVLTAHGPCYKDPTGVYVVPINLLRD